MVTIVTMVVDMVVEFKPQGHHLSPELKTPKTRNRKMAAAEVYK